MSSNWFDFDDDIASEFFDESKIERIKRNAGINSKKFELRENWRTTTELNDILDLASMRRESLRGKSKLLDSLLKDSNLSRYSAGRTSRLADDMSRTRRPDARADDFFSDVDAKVSRIKSRFSDDAYEPEIRGGKEKKECGAAGHQEKSSSSGSANSYAFPESVGDSSLRSRKDSMDSSTWSRKSTCQQPTVNFPSSSASTITDAYDGRSGKSIGRSISRESDDSVCTEKSINSSTVSEKLADGTDKTQFETNESWLKKSTSGSKVAEKKVNDVTMTEKNDDGMCEKSTTRMSYVEKSATGSSLQEEMASERVTSSGKGGTKTVKQKTSSETIKKLQTRNPPTKSGYYDGIDPAAYDRFAFPSSFSKLSSENRAKTSDRLRKDQYSTGGETSARVSEKISRLIDEAVHQEDLFRIPSSLQTDIDKITDDFFGSKSFEREKGRTRGRRLADLFSGTDNEESYVACSKLTRLKSENDSLQQENLKLQSIIQDVTAVNKRWQKYNNERRLYVQKLLSTIQDLQEQINLISEKSAFQSKSKEEVNSRERGEIDRLKKEHQDRVAVLELQIKAHKEDWDAERREKKKILQERDDMENRIRELVKDIKLLREILHEERQRKNIVCVSCKSKCNDESDIVQRVDFCPQTTSLNVSTCTNTNYCKAVHIPYNATDVETGHYYGKEDLLEDDSDLSPYYVIPRGELSETFTNERYNRTSKGTKTVTSDTVVVEDENGIRLAITEQFPSKDTNLKSILKKSEKKSKSGSKSLARQDTVDEPKTSKNRKTNPDIKCEDCGSEATNSFEVSIGFQGGGVAQVTSFVPNSNSMHYLSIGKPHVLNVGGEISRSKSEPNTRSNSSENLNPLRESSSWNNQSFSVDGNSSETVTCPDCHKVFPSPVHLKHFDHYQICQPEKNQF